MIVKGFGIEFRSLQKAHLEMVRMWRNSPKVQSNMLYQKTIEVEQQIQWFESINNVRNLYFVFYFKGNAVGLINLKNIDWEAREGEGGIFIGDVNYLNSIIPIGASILMAEFLFEVLDIQQLHAKVLKTNKTAIEYNKGFGYILTKEEDKFVRMVVTPQSYKNKSTKLKNAYLTIQNLESTQKTSITTETIDKENGWYQLLLKGFANRSPNHNFTLTT